MVVFGDSLSDTGNVHALTAGWIPASPPNFDGRFSNGPIWIERLAEELGLPAPSPSLDGGMNFAYERAATGPGFSSIVIPNMGMQILRYLPTQAAASDDPSDDLFVLWGGGNDFLRNGQIDPAVPATNMATHIRTLVGAGARHVLVPNLPPLGQIPQNVGGSDADRMDQFSAQFNTLLATELDVIEQYWPATIYRLDIAELFHDVLENPSAYGLQNVTQPALIDEASGNIVANPEVYAFWDGIHPTTATHQIIGAAAAKLFETVPVAGDADGDGLVDRRDAALVLRRLGTLAEANSGADVTGDGVVNLSDVALVQANFAPRSPATAPIPEPATAMLALAAWATAMLRRSSRPPVIVAPR